MEPELRGIIENFIDEMLDEITLKRYLNMLKLLEEQLIIKSAESALFGEIYGMILMAYVIYKYEKRKIPIPEKDKLQFHKVMFDNARKIMDKIRFVANL